MSRLEPDDLPVIQVSDQWGGHFYGQIGFEFFGLEIYVDEALSELDSQYFLQVVSVCALDRLPQLNQVVSGRP